MPAARPGLSLDRIIDAAARVADGGGLPGVSMRNVGRELGVEAMSLYHHVANKDALLDELADWIFVRVELPGLDRAWRPAMVERASSLRAVLAAHPWGLDLVASRRTPGPALLRHHDRVLGCLRSNGFGVSLAAHAFSAIDAYVYGFVVTELNLPFDAVDGPGEMAVEFQQLVSTDTYPYLLEQLLGNVGEPAYSYADEFDYGLDLILDTLEIRLVAPT